MGRLILSALPPRWAHGGTQERGRGDKLRRNLAVLERPVGAVLQGGWGGGGGAWSVVATDTPRVATMQAHKAPRISWGSIHMPNAPQPTAFCKTTPVPASLVFDRTAGCRVAVEPPSVVGNVPRPEGTGYRQVGVVQQWWGPVGHA